MLTPLPPDLSMTHVVLATRATYAAFAGAGFAFASWASRIPQVRDHLHLSPAELGLVLLAIAAGSIIALPLSGPIVGRFGSRVVVLAMALMLGVAMMCIPIGNLIGLIPVDAWLFLFGFANGMWDVGMNVQGAVVERLLGRSIMSRFHAGFSLGTVGGALLGAAMVALDVPVTVHLAVIGVVVAALVLFAVRAFVPDQHDQTESDVPPVSASAAWLEPRTLLIGLFVLAFAFAEGTGNDWISVALIDGYRAPEAVGTLAFAVFLTAMTAGRWFGPGLLDRYGRVPVCRSLAVLATAGLALFVFGGWLPIAFAGAALWGLGTSLGFPVGMSAGADEAAQAPARVSVIASIGYCAFLGGPPLIGFIGDHATVLKALLAVAVLMALATVIAGSTRAPEAAK